jgi:hypothetical protein
VRKRFDAGMLVSELAGLPSLDRQMLVRKWQELYGKSPPSGISQQLLLRAISYKLQEQTVGGLKPATRRFLVRFSGNGKSQSLPTHNLKTGTRLLREWHGITHEVMVLENGVQYHGECYRSLSEVARSITGTRWSGPRFFRLIGGGNA